MFVLLWIHYKLPDSHISFKFFNYFSIGLSSFMSGPFSFSRAYYWLSWAWYRPIFVRCWTWPLSSSTQSSFSFSPCKSSLLFSSSQNSSHVLDRSSLSFFHRPHTSNCYTRRQTLHFSSSQFMTFYGPIALYYLMTSLSKVQGNISWKMSLLIPFRVITLTQFLTWWLGLSVPWNFIFGIVNLGSNFPFKMVVNPMLFSSSSQFFQFLSSSPLIFPIFIIISFFAMRFFVEVLDKYRECASFFKVIG